jgi:signal transduction histidine kinase
VLRRHRKPVSPDDIGRSAMPVSSSPSVRPLPRRAAALALVALAVVVLVSASRALGFGDGILLAAAPASGAALAAGVVLRGPGALAAAAGFAAAGLAWGLSPAEALLDAAAHGLAAWAASTAMRALARRRAVRNRTSDWLIGLAGTVTFAVWVGAVVLVGGLAGALGPEAEAGRTALLATLFQPLGILTLGSMLASLGEWRRVLGDPLPGLYTLALGTVLLALLWLLLALPDPALSDSGLALLLSLPFCLWIAMQRRSLDGAALSFVAAHVALVILLVSTGGIGHPDYVTAVVYLNLLVAVCQLVHAVNRDRLSALDEVEAQKAELEKRVIQRTARLHALTEQALAADAAKTRFLDTVSHEVRTPLSGVIGMANVVLAGRLDPTTRRHVEVIRTSGFHLLDVINRLLDYSSLNHAARRLDAVDFDLGDLVDEVLEEASFLPYAAGVAFRREIAPGLPLARRGYRHGLRQVLTNLVGNAAKFTDEGTVTVRLSALPGDGLRIEVEDTGIGIPEAAQARIFEAFEQGDDRTARRHGGTGLGLAISAEVVRRLDGRIGVFSAPGEGATFWVEVPLPRQPGAASPAAAPAPPARA